MLVLFFFVVSNFLAFGLLLLLIIFSHIIFFCWFCAENCNKFQNNSLLKRKWNTPRKLAQLIRFRSTMMTTAMTALAVATAIAITMCIVYKVFDVRACIKQVYCSAHPPSGIALYTQNIVTNRLILSIWEKKTFHTQYGHPWWSSRMRYKIGVELNLWTKIKWKKQQKKTQFYSRKKRKKEHIKHS